MSQIIEAHQIFSRQAIVIVVAIIEGILGDFFQCVFYGYPDRMYEYLSRGDESYVKGKVDLKEIIEAESRNDLLYKLSVRASDIATQGKFPAIVNSLSKVTKNAISKKMCQDVIKLVERRNRIVHEMSKEKVSDIEVKKAFDYVIKFIEDLERAAKSMSIPVMELD